MNHRPKGAWLPPLLLVLLALGLAVAAARPAIDPLPSWKEGPAKEAIVRFVLGVTELGTDRYVPPAQRVAVFDNDGTLWAEKPAYTQLVFAIDRVKALAEEHPEWKTQQPFQAALEGDLAALASTGHEGLLQLVMASHAGMTTDEFAATVREWIDAARDRRFERPYTGLVYQPMLELLSWLRANGFRTWIVTGGGADFVRVFAEEVYGIPPEQVIGSRIETEYRMGEDGVPRLVRLPKLAFIDDKAGKPVAIHEHIGRRPLMAFGNSDGDHEMLSWTAAGPGPRFAALVHHTDADREWAYDRESTVGRLDAALDDAEVKGWTVIDMHADWSRVFPFQ